MNEKEEEEEEEEEEDQEEGEEELEKDRLAISSKWSHLNLFRNMDSMLFLLNVFTSGFKKLCRRDAVERRGGKGGREGGRKEGREGW